MVFYQLNNESASEEDFEVRESRKRKRQSQNNIHKDAIHPRKKKMKLQSISIRGNERKQQRWENDVLWY